MDVPVIISDMLQQSFVEFVEVPQLQFIDRVVVSSKGFLPHFAHFFALLRVVPELSASRSWGALDDEEFFVIEGSGVALTPGVSPKCVWTDTSI